MIGRLLTQFGRSVSLVQILVYLPLSLDIHGKDCFLALSLSLSLYYFTYSTVYLIFRNTRLSWISSLLGLIQNLVIPILLLVCFNLFSNDQLSSLHSTQTFDSQTSSVEPEPIEDNSRIRSLLHTLIQLWQYILNCSTPTFVVLEGISTLLCIQSVGQISRYLSEVRSESYSFLFLVLSAVIYVVSSYFLWDCYSYSARERMSATLIGVSVTSVGFLTGISINNRSGNVVETSLMMAYLTYNIYWLSPEKLDPVSFFSSFKSAADPPLPKMILQSATAIVSFVSTTFGAGLDFLLACSSALPLPVFINLLYRIVVLYCASRVVIAIKRAHGLWDYTRRLSDEEPMVRVMTIVVSYSRLILISVYTHLLLLNNEGHQVFWRWINVFVTLGLWGVEIMISKEEGDNDSIVTGLGIKVN
ncbi:ICE2-domain-containing protein [Phakopsora pachyrhizi]|uniref:ICE2-domain-containing protein n=1 Tax=Phakopsora pachyrhizi TaxID=170000 RepID=A0AAV0AIA3_PHAPC|nr:ICE2-domain-containing protein [Phakopsora pachyrhizi]